MCASRLTAFSFGRNRRRYKRVYRSNRRKSQCPLAFLSRISARETMCNITKILKRYVATDIDTTNKLLGAAAIVVNKTGEHQPFLSWVDVPLSSTHHIARRCSILRCSRKDRLPIGRASVLPGHLRMDSVHEQADHRCRRAAIRGSGNPRSRRRSTSHRT